MPSKHGVAGSSPAGAIKDSFGERQYLVYALDGWNPSPASINELEH